MEFINANWQIIICVVIAATTAVLAWILYSKNKVTIEELRNLADYLDTIDDGTGLVSLLASYAKRAVIAVEQLAKAGAIPKTDLLRREKAIEIVHNLAECDGVDLDEEYDMVIEELVEAAVFTET